MIRSEEYKRMIRSRRWQSVRLSYLKEHPLCERCSGLGLTVPAKEVHHIVPVSLVSDRERMARMAYDKGNLMALCVECHHAIHEELESRSKAKTRERAKAEAEDFAKRFGLRGDCNPGHIF